MKIHLMNFKNNHIIFLILMLIMQTSHCFAFEFTEDKDIDEEDVWELNLEDNISYPSIPESLHSVIKKNIEKQYKNLKKQGYNVSQVRNDEVIKIVLSVDEIFKTNTSEVSAHNCEKYLNPIIPYLKITDLYRVIFTIHHDNSLNSSDADKLTQARVFSVIDWLQLKHQNAKNIIPYSMGNEDPITMDRSKKAQKKNRRLEIYIIPGKLMVELANENKL